VTDNLPPWDYTITRGTLPDVLATAVDDLGTTEPPDDRDDLIAAWDRLEQIHRELGVIVRDYATRAGDMLDGGEYIHPAIGPVHAAQTKSERWRGYHLVDRLARPLVDTDTGEIVPAVSVRVLRDVLPACGGEDQTSSRWRTTGLRGLVDVDQYRTVEYGPAMIRRGPRR
jgi:hypothetical protein